MATMIDTPLRPELLDVTDATIEDAVSHADPMVLRGLIYQLTGDKDLVELSTKPFEEGIYSGITLDSNDGVKLVRRKAADFLKAYRDSGAGEIDIGPGERLKQSLRLMYGIDVPDENIGLYIEDLAIDRWARSLKWKQPPTVEQLEGFSVTIIGAGMGGLNAAIQLKRAGIPYTIVEKNYGVGGTWHENRYPGARVDTPSRSYTHLFGVDFDYESPFCHAADNQRYFDWVADTFEIRNEIRFGSEVRSLIWNETTALWEIRIDGADGEYIINSNAVITAVGFLNRPNLPAIPGIDDFCGKSWHTSRWPQDVDLTGSRVAVIGTGATGYQMVPELALEAENVTVFQRNAQWVFPISGYLSPYPPQVEWLDRNLPFHTNFMRARTSYLEFYHKLVTVDPGFDDPHACSPENKAARDSAISFLEKKIADPELRRAMTPEHPVWSARAIMIDPDYSILDAVQRDNVTLETAGIKRITATGIETEAGVHHEVDVIVYATGFHATEYLYPMKVVGRGGVTLEDLWANGGARAYLTCMMPGFPNFFSIYGPNTNGGLHVGTFHEMVMAYAMQCLERLILGGERTIEVREAAYWKYSDRIDAENAKRVWADGRTKSYYWEKHGRTSVQNPLNGPETWRLLRKPDFSDLIIK